MCIMYVISLSLAIQLYQQYFIFQLQQTQNTAVIYLIEGALYKVSYVPYRRFTIILLQDIWSCNRQAQLDKVLYILHARQMFCVCKLILICQI